MNAPLTDWDAPEYNEAAIGGGPKTIDVDAPEEGEATDQVKKKISKTYQKKLKDKSIKSRISPCEVLSVDFLFKNSL